MSSPMVAYFIAFLSQVLRRYEHSQIGLAAGAGKRRYVTLLAVRLSIHRMSMCSAIQSLPCRAREPIPQGQTFLAQQHVSAVSGVYAPDGVVLREVGDVLVLCVHPRLGMKTFYEVCSLVELFDYGVVHVGHYVHGKHHIYGISPFYAYL